MTKSIRLPLAAAALAALVLALPLDARAEDAEPPAEEGPKTVLKYAACAAGLAFVTDAGSAYAAIAYCLKTFFDEFHP